MKSTEKKIASDQVQKCLSIDIENGNSSKKEGKMTELTASRVSRQNVLNNRTAKNWQCQ